MGQVTVQQALQKAADTWQEDRELDWTTAPVHQLVALTLFDIANSGSLKERGSIGRATKAQKIILNRMVGLRQPGSRPVSKTADGIEFVDLTMGALQ